MDAARSRMVRSLVILGALLGVFALHGLSLDRAEEMPAPVVQTMSTLQVDPHGVTERIEQLAMTAPFTLAVDTSDHHHLVMPCAAFLLLLLVWVGVVLPRRRFGDGPLLPRAAFVPVSLASASPHLTKLCILRT